jgi:hypothetical protein
LSLKTTTMKVGIMAVAAEAISARRRAVGQARRGALHARRKIAEGVRFEPAIVIDKVYRAEKYALPSQYSWRYFPFNAGYVS